MHVKKLLDMIWPAKAEEYDDQQKHGYDSFTKKNMDPESWDSKPPEGIYPAKQG